MQHRADFGHYLNSCRLLGVGAEIGVFRGDFAEQILRTWTGKKLIAVDPWRHIEGYLDSWNLSDDQMQQNYCTTIDRLRVFGDRVSIMRLPSAEAAALMPDESFDFVYIDANHSYAAMLSDLHVWFPKIRGGGLFSGHDYFDAVADKNFDPVRGAPTAHLASEELTSYGVKRAVDQFAAALGATVLATDERLPTWYFQKAAEQK